MNARTTQKTVSDFERGVAGLQLNTLERLLSAMGWELTTREASPRPTLDELSTRYSDDLGESPVSHTRVRRARRR